MSDQSTLTELKNDVKSLTLAVNDLTTSSKTQNGLLSRLDNDVQADRIEHRTLREEFRSHTIEQRQYNSKADEAWGFCFKDNGESAAATLRHYKETRQKKESVLRAFLASPATIFGGVMIASLLAIFRPYLPGGNVQAPPTQTQQQGLSDADRKAIVDDVLKGLKQRTEQEQKQQTDRRPKNAKRKPPAMPSARGQGTLAKDSRFIAKGTMPSYLISGKDIAPYDTAARR